MACLHPSETKIGSQHIIILFILEDYKGPMKIKLHDTCEISSAALPLTKLATNVAYHHTVIKIIMPKWFKDKHSSYVW